MAQLRTVYCDIEGCKQKHEEKSYGDGWPGWGQLHGINLNGNVAPMLCPKHLEYIADFVDRLGHREDEDLIDDMD